MPLSVPPEVASERTPSWGAGLVAAWMAGVVVVLVGMAYREERLASADWSRVKAALSAQPGWRLRHILPAGAEASRALLDHLLARGRLPGLAEELAGSMPTELAARLREAGWGVAPVLFSDASRSGGWLEIYAPDGSLAWRGAYQAADLASGAGVLREDIPLAAALATQPFPPFVPALCATTPAGMSGFLGTGAAPKPSRTIAFNLNLRP